MLSKRFRLSVMMFLQFFIWGAWYPLVFGYLPKMGFDDGQQFLILATFNVGAIVAMFFSTQFADRHFAAERFLAFSMVVSGAAILLLAYLEPGKVPVDPTKPDGAKLDAPFWPFFLLLLVHSLFYVPTISITNSIAFTNLKDAQQDFGFVRLWGTIGWIAAAWPFVFILVDWENVPGFGSVSFTEWLGTALGTGKKGADALQATSWTFVTAGTASLVLAAFSLGLPHTPPKPAEQGGERFAWLDAMKLLRHPFVLVLFVVTFIDAAVHQYYFVWTGRYLEYGVGISSNWVMPVMSVGQIAEIGTMAILGYVLKSLGWRTTMVIGVLGHAARFAAFAFLPYAGVAITVNLLHGICYAFFFATVYIFVDEFFPKDARASAQGLFNLLILGLGPLATNLVAPRLGTRFQTGENAFDFQMIFVVPCVLALAAALILFLFFHPPQKASVEAAPLEPEPVTAGAH